MNIYLKLYEKKLVWSKHAKIKKKSTNINTEFVSLDISSLLLAGNQACTKTLLSSKKLWM